MAIADYNPAPPTLDNEWSDIAVPCHDAAAARRLDAELSAAGVDVTKVEGNRVFVPWGGSPGFLFDVLALAVDRRHISDIVAAAYQRQWIDIFERNARWSR